MLINCLISLMLCVEFLQVKYIDVSDITHVLKAAATMGSEHLKLSMIFVVSHFLSAKVSPSSLSGG